jgi:hypothetical protein
MPGTGLAQDYAPLLRLLWATVLPVLIPFGNNVNTVRQSGRALARLVLAPEMENVTGKYFEGRKQIASSKES